MTAGTATLQLTTGETATVLEAMEILLTALVIPPPPWRRVPDEAAHVGQVLALVREAV